MSLEVTHDGTTRFEPAEHCCLCRVLTRYWYTPKDVVVCQQCAKTAKETDLPTKEEWFAKEERLGARGHKSTFFDP